MRALVLLLFMALSQLAVAQHRFVKLNVRYHRRDDVTSGSQSAKLQAPDAAAAADLEYPAKADPGLSLTLDSDADETLQHDEAMRLMMRRKAETVIVSHSGDSLSAFEVECILNGQAPSLHPGFLSNVSWTMDMFESGSVLPTISTTSQPNPETVSPFSTSATGDARDLNHDGVVSVDELLASFFHADHITSVFHAVQSETQKPLDKDSKKEIIKQKAPTLHKAIEKVASNRGWGVQDSRFSVLHHSPEEAEAARASGGKAFEDYNTFVKTMRSALITPKDAAKDEVQEQLTAPRDDPESKT